MTSPQPPIRAAIIGYGGSGKLSHADPMRERPEFEIRAVCDVSSAQREQAQKEQNCPVYESVDQLLEHAGELDLAVVVTRTDTHCQIVRDCLRAGLHVVVTKPWALNRAEADQMIEASIAADREIFPWMPMSWSPEYLMIQGLLQEETIGDVFLVRRQIASFWKRDDWQTRAEFGGGYLLNWGMHIVQPVLDLVPSPAIRVFGQMQQTVNPGDTEDNFLAAIEFENGTRGIAEYTQALEGLPSFMIQGTRGMIHSDGETLTVLKKDPGSDKSTERSAYPITGKRYGDELEIYADIAASLQSGKPMRATTRHAYYGTLVLDAIRESHQTRQTVAIPDCPIPDLPNDIPLFKSSGFAT